MVWKSGQSNYKEIQQNYKNVSKQPQRHKEKQQDNKNRRNDSEQAQRHKRDAVCPRRRSVMDYQHSNNMGHRAGLWGESNLRLTHHPTFDLRIATHLLSSCKDDEYETHHQSQITCLLWRPESMNNLRGAADSSRRRRRYKSRRRTHLSAHERRRRNRTESWNFTCCKRHWKRNTWNPEGSWRTSPVSWSPLGLRCVGTKWRFHCLCFIYRAVNVSWWWRECELWSTCPSVCRCWQHSVRVRGQLTAACRRTTSDSQPRSWWVICPHLRSLDATLEMIVTISNWLLSCWIMPKVPPKTINSY